MKSKLKEISGNGLIPIFILYFLLSMIMISVSYYMVQQKELDSLSRGLYQENSLFFMVDQNTAHEWDWRKLRTTYPFTIFKELETGEMNVRALYYKEDTYKPPMVAGRFFNEDDFYSDHKYAVIGQRIAESALTSLDGRRYYLFQGKKFEVIGSMGAAYPSTLDTTVLLNLDALGQQTHLNNIYVLNSPAVSSVLKNGYLIFENLSVKVNVFDRGDAGAQRYVGIDIYRNTIIITVFLLLVCSSVIFTMNWYDKKKTEINWLWIMGIKSEKVIAKFSKRYYVAVSLSYLLMCTISLFLFLIARASTENIELYVQYLLIGYVLILLSSYLSISVTVKRIGRTGKDLSLNENGIQ
ncbi:ABC transporter permease [Paenibacillus jamilae]|uniref:ABC transporter permease n=1 Tax=Paenibacillus jamilae TaxID=114136 RepID=UPI003D27A3F3